MCTKISRFMWFNGLAVTRATSRSGELRLQGDQSHIGLRSATGGIQGFSPTVDNHQLQLGGIKSREGQVLQRTWGQYVISGEHPLCHGLQRKNHGWGGCLHLLGVMIAAEE